MSKYTINWSYLLSLVLVRLFATAESVGRLSTSVWHLDFWDRLGNQYEL